MDENVIFNNEFKNKYASYFDENELKKLFVYRNAHKHYLFGMKNEMWELIMASDNISEILEHIKRYNIYKARGNECIYQRLDCRNSIQDLNQIIVYLKMLINKS